MTRACRWAGPGYALALALAVVAPVWRPGYLLLRDAVSTPRSYPSAPALGLGESAPRATPQDFAVALASQLVDGGVVVKALLTAGLWLAGWGAAHLAATVLPDAGGPGQFVATTVAIWNPYVAERLLQGHWSLLVGYGCLPWVAAAVLTLRSARGVSKLAFWLALAGLTPTGLALAAAVALACAAVPAPGRSRPVRAATALGLAAAAALPWLTAWLVGPASAGQPASAGVAAFAARAEPGLGTAGSLAGLGGIWNADAVPDSRATPFAVAGTVVLLGVVAAGLPAALRRPPAAALAALAAAAVAVPAALATGAGMAALGAIVDAAPGLGIIRDGHKWTAAAMPGYALAGAGAVVALRRRAAPAATALVCGAAVVAVLPDLAWGVGAKIAPVDYPPGWAAVAERINAEPSPVAVLPAGSMRRFAWSGPAPVLDPLPRWVCAEVLATGDLTVSGRVVAGEGARARDVEAMLLAGAEPGALTRAGVGWVVVESGIDGERGAAAQTLAGLPVAYRDDDLELYRVGGQVADVDAGPRRAALAAHLAWLGLLVAGGVGAAAAGWRRATATANS